MFFFGKIERVEREEWVSFWRIEGVNVVVKKTTCGEEVDLWIDNFGGGYFWLHWETNFSLPSLD